MAKGGGRGVESMARIRVHCQRASHGYHAAMTLPAPRLVLVEPQQAGNLGFVARLLANFALRDWWTIGGVPWRGSEAERTGAMALPLLEALRVCTRLDDALADRSHVVGFTARSGFRRDPVPIEALQAEAAAWGPDATPALLFGREDRGLETAECERCALLVRIPAPGLQSFNLSHAIALALHEWHRGRTALPPVDVGPSRAGPGRWSGEDDKLRLALKTVAALRKAGFPAADEELEAALRRILALPLERRDVRLLERILRHVEWLEERAGRATARPGDPADSAGDPPAALH
jgi:tRNA/rRNA methyltransferase